MPDLIGQLLERLAPLLRSCSDGAVVLERVARGGGSTRWFSCRIIAEVEAVLPQLRSGSRVAFFFDDRIRRRPFSEQVEQELWELVAAEGEAVFGKPLGPGPEIKMELLDATDFGESMARVSAGEPVYYGRFPSTDDDGDAAVSFIPPDEDGLARPQPV